MTRRGLLITADGLDRAGTGQALELLGSWIERRGQRVEVVQPPPSAIVRRAAASRRTSPFRVADARGDVVVASAGALVNDGRRDASFLEIAIDDGSIQVDRRSVSTGKSTTLFRSGEPATPGQRKPAAARR